MFLSCQPLFKSVCPCVCLSLPPESFVWNIPLKPQLSPVLSMFFLAWVNSDEQQVYPRIQSPLARPASCDRSMTKPVRAAHRYSGLDCMWKLVDHVTDELKKRSAIIDQSDWQASISSFFYERKQWLLSCLDVIMLTRLICSHLFNYCHLHTWESEKIRSNWFVSTSLKKKNSLYMLFYYHC